MGFFVFGLFSGGYKVVAVPLGISHDFLIFWSGVCRSVCDKLTLPGLYSYIEFHRYIIFYSILHTLKHSVYVFISIVIIIISILDKNFLLFCF